MVDEDFSKALSPRSLQDEKDLATVERTEDDKSWMELSFVNDDDNGPFSRHSAVMNVPPESVSLKGLVLDDNISLSSDELNGTPTAAEPPKPSEDTPKHATRRISKTKTRRKIKSFDETMVESPKPSEDTAKSVSRRRSKKTKTHRKQKSFDERVLMDSGITGKKKKKKDKTSKTTKGGDSGEFSVKSKRKKRNSTPGAKPPTDDNDEQALLGGEDTSDHHSLRSNQSSKASPKRRGLKSLSPMRIRNPLRGRSKDLKDQLTSSDHVPGGRLLGRAKDLKDQLTLSDHVPGDKKGIMGKVLYSSFDDEDDSDLDDSNLFT